jgi:PAS domain-containing protein
MSQANLSQASATAVSGIHSEHSVDDDTRAARFRETRLFPLFAEMMSGTKVPTELYAVFQGFQLLQVMISGFWLLSRRCWESVDAADERTLTEDVLEFFLTFGFHKTASTAQTIYVIVAAVFALGALAFHVLVIYSFQQTHRFAKWQIFVARFLELCVCPVALPMCAGLAGAKAAGSISTAMSPEGMDGLELLLLVLAVGATILVTLVYLLPYGLFCVAPVVDYHSILAAWTSLPMTAATAVVIFISFCGPALDEFAGWIAPVLIVVTLLAMFLVLFQLREMPFQRGWMNSVFAGVFVCNMVGQIFAGLRFIGVAVSAVISIPASLGVGVIAGVVASLGLAQRRRRIAAALSYTAIRMDADGITEADKKSYLETLQFSGDAEIFAWLQVGVSSGCDMFLDFSFPHFVLEQEPSVQLVLLTARVLCFFPTELQYLGSLLAAIERAGPLDLRRHFLLFQMRKVFVMRQSSLSREVSTVIRKMRKEARDAIAAIRSMWIDIVKRPLNLNFAALTELQHLGNRVQGNFRDWTDKYANSQDICHEYAHFLIDGLGEFKEACLWKARAELIERGVRLDTDHSFKSLMNQYPHYLLNDIYDDTGRPLKGRLGRRVQTGSHSSNSGVSSGSMNTLKQSDLELVAQNVIHEASLRLAVQGATERMSLTGLTLVQVVPMGESVVALILAIAFLTIVSTARGDVSLYLDGVHLMDDSLGFVGMSSYACGLAYANSSNLMDAVPFGTYGGISLLHLFGFVPPDVDLPISGRIVQASYDRTRQAKQAILEMARLTYLNNWVVPKAIDVMMNSRAHYIAVETMSIDELSGRSVLNEALDQCGMGAVSAQTIGSTSISESRFVEGAINILQAIAYMSALQDALVADGRAIFSSYKNQFQIIGIAAPVVFGVLFLAVAVYAIWRFYTDFNRALRVLRAVKQDTVNKSLFPISRGVHQAKLDRGASRLAKTKSIVYPLLPFALVAYILAHCVLMCVGFLTSGSALVEIDELQQWFVLAQQRQSSLEFLMSAVAVVSGIPDQWYYKEEVEGQIGLFKDSRDLLLVGSPEVGLQGIVGFDEELDTLQLSNRCESTPDSFFELARCMSIDRAMSASSLLFDKVTAQIQWTPRLTGNMTDARYPLRLSIDYADLVVILETNLIEQLPGFTDKLLDFTDDRFGVITNSITVVTVALIVVTAAGVVLFAAFSVVLSNGFESIRVLLRLLPPRELVQDSELVSIILGIDADANAKVLTPSEVAVQRASEGILSLSLDYTIEAVNAAFIDATRLSADEVIGQNLQLIFPFPGGDEAAADSSVAALYRHLESLKEGGGTEVTAIDVSCTNDVGSPLDMSVMVVPHTNSDQRLTSFSLLLRDLSKQSPSEQKSVAVKGRCMNILQQLVPAEVWENLRSGMTQTISFMSNSATVIFVSILGLSDSVDSYGPSQIMEALAAEYDAFDECAHRNASIRQLQFEACSIIACAGLFDFQDQPADQVQHAVSTCLAFMSRQEDLCEKLSLQVGAQCAIAFGGPLVGDLLDAETPTFELYGELVQLALGICEEAAPNTVSINGAGRTFIAVGPFDTQRVDPAGKKFTDVYMVQAKEDE